MNTDLLLTQWKIFTPYWDDRVCILCQIVDEKSQIVTLFQYMFILINKARNKYIINHFYSRSRSYMILYSSIIPIRLSLPYFFFDEMNKSVLLSQPMPPYNIIQPQLSCPKRCWHHEIVSHFVSTPSRFFLDGSCPPDQSWLVVQAGHLEPPPDGETPLREMHSKAARHNEDRFMTDLSIQLCLVI